MKAIILTGGKGTRLAPYTTVLPKPLIPIGDMPILEVVLRQLSYYGFTEIILAVGYLAELLMAYCGDGSKFGLRISYSQEEKPLETAGPIGLISDLNESFILMNGDLLTTIDYNALMQSHHERGSIATLAAYCRDVKIDLGVVHSQDNWVTDYVEKPTYHFTVSSGIYIFEPSIKKYIIPGEYLDLPDLVLNLIKDQKKINLYPFDGYWLDIGCRDDYEIAMQQFAVNRKAFLPGL